MDPEGSLPHSQKPVPILILILINPLHAFTSHFLKIHINIILPYYYSLLFHLNNIWWGIQIMKLLITYFSPHLVTYFLLGPNTLLSNPFWNNLSPCSSFNVSHKVSHPYKTTSKITVLFILMFLLLDCKMNDKRFSADY